MHSPLGQSGCDGFLFFVGFKRGGKLHTHDSLGFSLTYCRSKLKKYWETETLVCSDKSSQGFKETKAKDKELFVNHAYINNSGLPKLAHRP